jgi:starvation-inducible DNA-binding protein
LSIEAIETIVLIYLRAPTQTKLILKGEQIMVKTPANPTIGNAPIDIGINVADRAAIANGLSRLLADTYTLYLTTHNFHWNVTGPMFNTLHTMFMEQYTELWNAVDPIAERIRALGHAAPGSYGEFAKLASVADAPSMPPRALDMVQRLVAGHETVVRTAREIFPIAAAADDQPTADLLTQRLNIHEKSAWMLRSLLED